MVVILLLKVKSDISKSQNYFKDLSVNLYLVDAPKLTNFTYFESALFPPFFEIKCRKSTAQWDINQIFSENSSGDYYKNAFEFIKIRVWGLSNFEI